MLIAVAEARESSENLRTGLDVAFLLFSAYIVFMMQLGFAVLCAGSIRSKNCMNILLKNVLDACVGAFGFYLLGYGFAFGHKQGEDSNGFIGNWNFALSHTTWASAEGGEAFGRQGWHMFMFQWSFCAAATTILSGAVAERCAFLAYLLYSLFLSALVYPVVVHWVWDEQGWLSAFNTDHGGYAAILKAGAIDFAGSGVVHVTGGVAALAGAAIIGPRVGRFDGAGQVVEMRGHSATLVVMGTFLLWFGWYGFNPGSNLVIASPAAATIVSRVAVCTTLGAASGGLTMLLYKYARTRTWDTVHVCMGVLSGLVAVTAGCAVLAPWAALAAGAVGAVVFVSVDTFTLHTLKVDDPVSAFPLHGGVGAWGVLVPGLLAVPQYVVEVYGSAGFGPDAEGGSRYGLLYGGHGQVLLAQAVELAAVAGWSGAMMGAFFFALNKAGLLRVSMEAELAGLDITAQGEGAAMAGLGGTGGMAGERGSGGGMGRGSLGGERGSGGALGMGMGMGIRAADFKYGGGGMDDEGRLT